MKKIIFLYNNYITRPKTLSSIFTQTQFSYLFPTFDFNLVLDKYNCMEFNCMWKEYNMLILNDIDDT